MLGWSINLFRIRGIQLAVHFSFILFLAWFAYDGYQDAGVSGALWGAATLLAFFTCVVLHELGHCFTGMRFGLHVRRILLMPIGGMAVFDSIPRKPREELLMTIAGPAVNFAIAGLLCLVAGYPHAGNVLDSPNSLTSFARLLAGWNLLMGIFNLTPAFPMDGGRILRALLATRLPYLRATKWAANIGKVVAGLGIAYGLFTSSYLLAVLFTFILLSGENEYRMLQRQEYAEAHWQAMMEHLARTRAGGPADEPPLLEPGNTEGEPRP